MQRILFFSLFLLSLNFAAFSQTTSKYKTTTTKKTTTKAAANKAVNVYVCTDPKDKLYHKFSSCSKLNKCAGQIKNVKSASELKNLKRKSCTHCFNL